MKKLLFSCATIALCTVGLSTKTHAQATSGTTNLHVILVDALNITVNTSDVTLTFATPTDYANGRDTTINNHLTVTSNQAYNIKVKAASANLTSGSNNIATNSVVVTVPAGQTGLGGSLSPATLSTNDGTVITGATAAVARNINVAYSVPSSISATSALLGKPAGDYTTTLTYTITQ